MRDANSFISWLGILLSMLLVANPAIGQTRLDVHGFLTQGYALSTRHPIFGIPTRGTADYRIIALQFRYELSHHNNAVIQFNHRRSGKSPLMQFEDDVSLDWAFFEHHFNDATSVKMGKILLPFGIYNEIRDVGILLPFYRAPFSGYGEENYMSETVDGIALSHTIGSTGSWCLDVNLYGGQWKWVEWFSVDNPLTGENVILAGRARVDKGGGVQTWLQTPLAGLNLGAGLHGGHIIGGLSFAEGPGFGFGEQNFYAFNFSVDASLSRCYLRSEYIQYCLDGIGVTAIGRYLQGGLSLTPRLTANFQVDYFDVNNLPLPPVAIAEVGYDKVSLDFYHDWAAGLGYAFTSQVVWKLEYHWNTGLLFEDGAGGVYENTPEQTRFLIMSLSTSF